MLMLTLEEFDLLPLSRPVALDLAERIDKMAEAEHDPALDLTVCLRDAVDEVGRGKRRAAYIVLRIA